MTEDARPWLVHYPEGVPADVEIEDRPLTSLLDDAARDFPDHVATAFLGSTLTYRQLHEQIARVAGGLRALGVGPGDRVALVLPNSTDHVVVFWAVLRLGAVIVECNPLYTAHELGHQLEDSGATVAVVLDRAFEAVASVRSSTSLRHVVVSSVADQLPARQRLLLRLPLPKARVALAKVRTTLPTGTAAVPFRVLRRGEPVEQHPVAPSDVALLQYTGGTTGVPKGAMLTHRNLLANAAQTAVWENRAVRGQEVMLAVLPMFHAYGLTFCLGVATRLAGTVVLLPLFDVAMVLEAIDRWRPTLFPGVPPMYSAIIDAPETAAHDLGSIRGCFSGAMRLPVETVRRFEAASGCMLVEGYGMTETSPLTFGNPMSPARRPGTIGVPMPSTYGRIADVDDPGRVLGPGDRGELQVRGPQVFAGYWKRPEESAAALTPDGWLRTGDVGVMTDDGFVTIVDRTKELIITGGFNVYPSEVEEALKTHPAVEDAAVFGVPDDYRGEAVKACVVLRHGVVAAPEDLRNHCRSELAAYKVPRIVEIRDSLPRSVVGKVMRRELREQHLAAVRAQGR